MTTTFVIALALSSSPALMAQFSQQGAKLIGTGATGAALQGSSVAISADGSTVIVGGSGDHSNAGAAWIFTRSGSVWTQQGSKLVSTGAVGPAGQGGAVALSADGNTAIVGGSGDSLGAGAAWIFTRSGGVWTQQKKLVGVGAVGAAQQGTSVSLSADGNMAIVGGPGDNSTAGGAAWIFTRSGSVWTQQGAKLVGTGSDTTAQQGSAVALSADGNTAMVGGPTDDVGVGAIWIFTRSGGSWIQQGLKLMASDTSGVAYEGSAVSLSADGGTAVVGGLGDGSDSPSGETITSAQGAAWSYTRSGGVWSQQGPKLVGTGAAGDNAQQGSAVSLSADGGTAIVGGWHDNSNAGASWIYTRSGGVWTQQGSKLVGTGASGAADQGASVALSADGTTAIVGGPFDNSGTGSVWIFVAPLRDLTVTMAHPGGAFAQGQHGAQYTLRVTNSGSAAASGIVTLTDTLPTGLTFASGAGGGFFCAAAGQTVTCTNAATPIPANGTATVVLNVNVATNAPATETSSATVACSCAESNTNNNTSNTDIVSVTQLPDLTVSMTHMGSAFIQGQQGAQYSLVVSNKGSAATTGTITVNGTLPAELTFASGSGGGFSCSASGQTATCTNPAMPIAANGTATATLNVNVAASAPASEMTSATVACTCTESDTTNNTSGADTVPVAASADLSIALTSSAGALTLPNSVVTYTITVVNHGSSEADGVAVTDALPSGLTLVSATPSQGSCVGMSTVACSIGTLANGASATITLAVTAGTTLGVVNNAATVAATTPDPNLDNNRASAAINIATSRPRRRAA